MIQEFFSASAQSTLRYQIIDGEGPLLIHDPRLRLHRASGLFAGGVDAGAAGKKNRADRLVRCG